MNPVTARVGEVSGRSGGLALVGDFLGLAKLRLSSLVMLSVTAGILWAPGTMTPEDALTALGLIFLGVASGAMLNCYMEREVDKLMERTMDRALPAGRVRPQLALGTGLTLALVSFLGLYFLVNPLTAILLGLALISYLLLYTPLKTKTPLALWPGALAGALPPLMGFSVAGHILDARALCLFLILFFWQIPHFLAISLYREEEYGRAGIIVYPHRMDFAWVHLFILLMMPPLGLASTLIFLWAGASLDFFLISLVINALFITTALSGFSVRNNGAAQRQWAKRLFQVSLFYLPLILGTVILL